MNSHFRIHPLSETLFAEYFEMSAPELAERNAALLEVTSNPGFPCRVSLEDARIGETVLLTEFVHHRASSPYRASGPIFVRKDVVAAQLMVDEVPDMLVRRHLSLRAYDQEGFMQSATIIQGTELSRALVVEFARSEIQYVDIHNAGPGCFDCRAHRLPSVDRGFLDPFTGSRRDQRKES